jgi:hypothetical protein
MKLLRSVVKHCIQMVHAFPMLTSLALQDEYANRDAPFLPTKTIALCMEYTEYHNAIILITRVAFFLGGVWFWYSCGWNETM